MNTIEPKISGSAVEGETLTATTGTWTGTQPMTFAFQWLRCPSNGGNGNGSNCAAIAGATTNSHLLRSADVGFTIRVRVTATNADGSGVAVSNATAIVVAASAPKNTSPPTISGTPQVGQTLTANPGTWTGTQPISFSYSWQRCDKNGGSCSVISGATSSTYTIPSNDVGLTLRVRVTATNTVSSASATSVPTAVIASAPPPSPPGCPAGSGPIPVANVISPARLLIDAQQASPSVVHRGAQQILLRYHVSACGGRSVQGALVYATGVPYNQLSIPGEQPTGPNGYAVLDFRTLAGFPANPQHQQLLVIFARARKPGEDLLGGISTRRLFSVPVKLH